MFYSELMLFFLDPLGYDVEFPCTPYGSQFAVMDRVLQALKHEENALLESPTGSGKTLALLCAGAHPH